MVRTQPQVRACAGVACKPSAQPTYCTAYVWFEPNTCHRVAWPDHATAPHPCHVPGTSGEERRPGSPGHRGHPSVKVRSFSALSPGRNAVRMHSGRRPVRLSPGSLPSIGPSRYPLSPPKPGPRPAAFRRPVRLPGPATTASPSVSTPGINDAIKKRRSLPRTGTWTPYLQ